MYPYDQLLPLPYWKYLTLPGSNHRGGLSIYGLSTFGYVSIIIEWTLFGG